MIDFVSMELILSSKISLLQPQHYYVTFWFIAVDKLSHLTICHSDHRSYGHLTGRIIPTETSWHVCHFINNKGGDSILIHQYDWCDTSRKLRKNLSVWAGFFLLAPTLIIHIWNERPVYFNLDSTFTRLYCWVIWFVENWSCMHRWNMNKKFVGFCWHFQ